MDEKRIGTGLKKLDAVLGGGFPSKSAILLWGGAGAGKTIFGLNFALEGARKGEECCYVSLGETKEELLRACRNIESLSDAEKYLGKNFVISEISMDDLSLGQFAQIFSSYPEIDRLVVDNTNRLLLSAPNGRTYRQNLYKIIRSIREKAECVLFLSEAMDEKDDSLRYESFECDGEIKISFAELGESRKRMMTVRKMRYTAFEPRVAYELEITSKRINLADIKLI